MAQKSTIFKAQINVADMDRHHYQDYNLTIARHPSETDQRMMLRIMCFALFAHENLEFTRGLSTDDEPDLWQTSLSGEIEHWIDLGQPDEKRIRRACGRAQQVTVVCYSGNGAAIWFDKLKRELPRFKNLTIINIDNAQSTELTELVERNMELQIIIEDRSLSVNTDKLNLSVDPVEWHPANH
jgi:uncharacterized protein YaeQ